MEKIKIIMMSIQTEKVLEEKHKEHGLQGEYKGCTECHIEPNWLLIYEIKKEENKVYFARTGTHSDLF